MALTRYDWAPLFESTEIHFSEISEEIPQELPSFSFIDTIFGVVRRLRARNASIARVMRNA